MRRLLLASAVLLLGAVPALAQQTYTYGPSRTSVINVPINWEPDSPNVQRYTVAVRPFRILRNGLQVDFEVELRAPGEWFQTSLAVYSASSEHNWGWWGDDGDYYENNHWGPVSGFEDYHDMWGVGTSALYKKFFSPRGWYFSTGVSLDYFRVGRVGYNFDSSGEWGLYRKSYIKPTAQINVGKHMALSPRCFFDLYVGLGISHSFYSDQNLRHFYDDFSSLGGFAYRGLLATGGFRFGVILW